MTCLHCGVETPRMTVNQRYCPSCDRRVRELLADAERRNTPRFGDARDGGARDLTGRVYAR